MQLILNVYVTKVLILEFKRSGLFEVALLELWEYRVANGSCCKIFD